MNISEMHIAVSQGVDKIHSFQADVLLREEIDLEINKNIQRFIEQRFNPRANKYQQGFEQSQKRIDDLRTLLVEHTAAVAFKEAILDGKFYVDTFRFPTNYMHLIRQNSHLYIDRCKPIASSLVTQGILNYVILSPEDLTGTNAAGTISYADELVYKPKGLSNSESVSVINGTIPTPTSFPNTGFLAAFLTATNNVGSPANLTTGFTIYWETYENIEAAGSFILIVDPLVHAVHLDGSSGTDVSAVQARFPGAAFISAPSVTKNLGSSDAMHVRKPVANLNQLQKRVVANKFIQHDDIYTLLNDPFNTTKADAPLTTIRNNEIEIYSNDIFLIDKIKILYLRKPTKVSLTLGQSCDLPEHTHQEIVDMTVSTILGNISDPRYQIAAAEKLQSE